MDEVYRAYRGGCESSLTPGTCAGCEGEGACRQAIREFMEWCPLHEFTSDDDPVALWVADWARR